ncbi:hypothetical protein F4677DRAFT_140806 [Hypoxylon crocopeplum]|nr:hypothetical protein F4677DRAFT_140806 [Hypoxylon crocopeplum]
MEYRSRYEWFRPTNHIFTEHIHNSMYRPWLVKLIAEARPVEQMDDEFRRRYTTEVLAERNKFVDYMDKNATPVWSSFGRWSRYEAPPQGADLRFTEAAVSEKRWTKAWYCKQHRPWHMCISCGWNYTCAVCANPHACPNCKNPFECAWTGCSNRSYNPEDNNTFYTYSIGATDLAPGRDKDGLRHTPIRIYMERPQ